MHSRVVIVGGGISGLIANYVFKHRCGNHTCDVKVIEFQEIGGEFLFGGLRYIHHTNDMAMLFDELCIPYSSYSVRGGISLRGSVLSYPDCFGKMKPQERLRIRRDYYIKTRLTLPDRSSRQSMNDPASIRPKRALRCDFEELINSLAEEAEIVNEKFIKLTNRNVCCTNSINLPYDFLIFAIPLWEISSHVPFRVPCAIAMNLNIAKIYPAKDEYIKWDYVYTPYTPADYIHKFSTSGDGCYAVEFNGSLDRLRLESDLNFIFPYGYFMSNIKTGLSGYMHTLPQNPAWPRNVAPLGRFAQWDPKVTVDVVLDSAHKLLTRWIGR